MNKFFYIFPVILGSIFGFMFASWMVERKPPIKNFSIELLDSRVSPGESLVQKIKLERIKYCNVVVKKTIRDYKNNIFLLPHVNTMVPGLIGVDKYFQNIDIPKKVAKGPAKVFIVMEWQCNRIHFFWPVQSEIIILNFDII